MKAAIKVTVGDVVLELETIINKQEDIWEIIKIGQMVKCKLDYSPPPPPSPKQTIKQPA